MATVGVDDDDNTKHTTSTLSSRRFLRRQERWSERWTGLRPGRHLVVHHMLN